LKRLRSSYADLALGFSRARLVKTDLGLEQSLDAALQIIASYLAERFDRQHASWLGRDNSARREGKLAESARR